MRLQAMAGRNVCYKTDGSGEDDDEDEDEEEEKSAAVKEKQALLKKIKKTVVEEIQSKGFKKSEEIQAMINAVVEGMDLPGLKKFKPELIEQSVANLAGAVEKLKNNVTQGTDGRLSAIKKLLEDKKTMGAIQVAFDKNSKQTVNLNVQAAVAVMTTGNVLDDGDIPEDILNSFSVDTFVKKRRPTEYIYDVVNRRTVANITEYKTWLEEGDEQGAFAIVAEGAVKPLVSKTLVRNTAKYRKAAGKRVYTEEFAKFRKEAYNIIEDLFNDQLLRNYADILQTDLLTWASLYVGTTLDGQYADPTDYHAIGAVAAQIETLNFVPDLLILNPQDKWRIGLQQTNQGVFYVNIPTLSPSGTVTMLGFRVLTSNKLTAGTFMLGESGLYKVEDEPVQIRLGYGINVTKDVNGFVTDVTSDVDTNRFRIIAETYFHNYVATAHTGSFVKGVFADIKAALAA